MKNIELIRKELNLTQVDMAMILNISRSQWSLYELGLRNLTPSALIRLSQAQNFLASSNLNEAKHIPEMDELEAKKKAFITEALKNNKFRQLKFERKITAMEAKYKLELKKLHLISFLEQPKDKKGALHPGVPLALKDKLMKAIEGNGSLQLLQLELEQKKLQYEEQLLTSLLKN